MTLAYPESFPQSRIAAAMAATRFGYGARPGEIPYIADDPGGWLLSQLEGDAVPDPLKSLPKTPAILRATREAEAQGGEALRRYRQQVWIDQHREAAQTILLAVNGPDPFRERLVRFWGEFFGVGLAHPVTAPFAHAFEREVIRPNLTRRFYDMMLAAVRHPALILKHDNHRSLAKRSPAGRDRVGNLETGLARTILEDLTIGPGGGERGREGSNWREPDVLALANMLTGWTVRDAADEPETAPAVERAPLLPSTFRFDADVHAEESKYFLGRNYPAAGVLEAEAALDTLTRLPNVARRLARLMARALVADDPPDAVVEDLAEGYAQYGGSLGSMITALADSNAAFEPALRKVKRPDDLVISVYRALAIRPERGDALLRDIAMLGMGVKDYAAPLSVPSGANHWLEPGRFADRLDWCAATAVRALQTDPGGPEAALALGFDVLGPRLGPQTFRRLSVALDAGESAALLFASPEFQTR